MAAHFEEVTVTLANQKVRFAGITKSHPESTITFDYKPPIGDGQGYNGLELLLMSLAGCSATTIAYLLRKMGNNVSGLTVNGKGIRRDKLPIKFETIFLEFVLHSGDTQDSDLEKAIRLAEESVCPVWQMIKNNAEVISEYRIVAE